MDLYQIGLIGFERDRMKFVDECHISTKNVVGIVGIDGLLAHRMYQGRMNQVDYTDFMMIDGLATLQAGDRLIPDNAAILLLISH